MSHPLMYVLGNTEEKNFPLILTIGREPNYDDVLGDFVGKINIPEFTSMSGGVWVTAYTQFAKQYVGITGTSSYMKNLCISKDASPIVFTNAFPCSIDNSVQDKESLLELLTDKIPAHINSIFSKSLISRVKRVVQHGYTKSEPSQLATQLIQSKCKELNIPYCSTPFFYNGNSKLIQNSLSSYQSLVKSIFDGFAKHE